MKMSQLRSQHTVAGETPSQVAIDAAGHSGGGHVTAVVSALALMFSGYSLWDSTLKGPDINVFVPPVIHYASPYNNTNFEMIAVPVTFVNEGGRTGTVLSIELEATNPKTKAVKRFYAADFGRWTMEKTRAGSYEPFAPISLTGKASRTETVLFYTKGPDEKPEQLITEPGVFQFKMILDEAGAGGVGSLKGQHPTQLSFEMELRNYDARAFQNGTLPMYATTGRSSKSRDAPAP